MTFSLILLNHVYFYFNDTATTEIYTLSLHDALPISYATAAGMTGGLQPGVSAHRRGLVGALPGEFGLGPAEVRSEEHTSELQSHVNLVCRLLLEKKKFCLILLTHGHIYVIDSA